MRTNPFRRDELIGATLHWLLHLELGGQTYRLAQRPLSGPLGLNGETVQYQGAILGTIEWEETADLLSPAPRSRSLSLTVNPFGLPVADLAAQVGSARATLFRWIEGTDRSVPYLTGLVLKPKHRLADQPISFTIETDPWQDAGDLADSDARVSLDTWSNPAEKVRGERYPIPIGYPGTRPSGSVPASPAFAVDATSRYLLIADRPIHAGQVTVYGAHDDSAVARSVTTTQDLLGRTVSVVQLPSSGTGAYDADGEWWVGFSDASGFGGGIINRRTGNPLRGASEVMAWALRRSTLPVDFSALIADTDPLNAYRIDTSIRAGQTEVVSPWGWVQAQVLSLCPASAVLRPGGLSVLPWRIGITRADVVAEATDQVDRWELSEQPVSYSSWLQCAGRIEISFARDQMRGEWDGVHTLSSSSKARFPGNREHYQLRVGSTRFGNQLPPVTEDLDVVYDAATAGRFGEWKAATLALPYRRLSFKAAPEWGWLRPTDPLYVDAPRVGVSQIVHVETIRYLRDGSHLITVVAFDHPRRDG